MPIIASSTFNKRLVEKVQKYRSEYAESHWKVWSQIAAEMSQEDCKTYAHLHLSKHFRNKLIPHLDSYALDEDLVNQLQYPYLRRVYHLQLCFYRGATQREDNVENITDNKLFIRYMTNGNIFDPEVLQLFKRRGSKASPIRKIQINVSDPAYAVPDHIQVHLTAMKRLFRGKFLYNGQRWVAPHTKPTAVSRPCEGSLIALDGELVRIENCSAPSLLLSSPCNLLEKESLVINTQEFEKMCNQNSQPPDFEQLEIDSAFAADLSDHRTQPEKDPLTLSSLIDSSQSITHDRSHEHSAITIGSSTFSPNTLTNESALDDDGDNEDISSSSSPNGESFNKNGISNVEYEDTMQSINSSCNTSNENNLETELPNDIAVVSIEACHNMACELLRPISEIDASDSPDEQMVSPPNIDQVIDYQSEPSTQRTRLDNGHIPISQEMVTIPIDLQVDVIVLDTSSDDENNAENLPTPHAKDSLPVLITTSNHGSVEENQRNSEHSSINTTGETVVEKIPQYVDFTPVPLIVDPVTGLSLSFFEDPLEDDAAALSEEDSDAIDSAEELMVYDNTTPNSLTHERSSTVSDGNPMVEDQLEGDAVALCEEDSHAIDSVEELMDSPRDDRFNKTNRSRVVEDQSEPSTKRIRLDNGYISIKEEVVTIPIDPQVDVIVLDTSLDEESDAVNSATPQGKDSLSAVITSRNHGSVEENQRNSEHSSINTTGETVVEKIPQYVDVTPVPIIIVCPGMSLSFFENPLEGDAAPLSEEDSDASDSSEELIIRDNTTPNSLTHERSSNVSAANPVVEDQLEGDAVTLGEEDSIASDSSEERMVRDNTTPNSLTHERSSNVSAANPVVEDQLEGDAVTLSEEDSDASDSSEELMVRDNTTPNSLTHERSSNVSAANPVVEDQLEGGAAPLSEEDSDASDSSEELMVRDNTTPNSLTHERSSNVSAANPVVADQLEGDAVTLGEEDSIASDSSEERMVRDNTTPNSLTHERSSNVSAANPEVEDQLEGDAVTLGEEDSIASDSSEERMVRDNTTPNSLTHERSSNVSAANPVVADQLEGDAVTLGEEDSIASDSSEERMVRDNTTPNSLTHERSSNVSAANPLVKDQLEGDAVTLGEEDSIASDSSEERMVRDNTTPNSLTHERSSNVSAANPVVADQLEGDAVTLGEEDSIANDSSEERMVRDNTTPNSLTHERSSTVSDANLVGEDQSVGPSAKPIELSTVANSIEQEEVAISTTDHEQEEERLSGQSVVSTYFERSSQFNSGEIQPPEIVCDSSSPIESAAETGHNRENTLSDGGDTDNSPTITAGQPPTDEHKALPSEQIDHPDGTRITNEVENTPMQDVGDEGDMVRSTTLVALVRSRLDDNLLLNHETLLRPMIMSKRKLWEEMRKSLPHLFVKQPNEAAPHSMSLLICHKLCLIRLVSEALKREYCISAKLETVMSFAAQLAYGTPDITKFLS